MKTLRNSIARPLKINAFVLYDDPAVEARSARLLDNRDVDFDRAGDFLPAEVLDPEPGDEIVIRGKNGIVYEGAYLDGDDKSVLARVWDREVGTNYTARWSWKYVVEINGQTPAVASV